MKSDEDEKEKVNEPDIDDSKNLTITTFAELEERDREFTRNLTHEQRLEYLQKLISVTHGNDLSEFEKKFYEGKITIRKPE